MFFCYNLEKLLGGDNMADVVQYVSFVLSNEKYAINIMSVEEILRKVDITPVPNAPSFIEGVVNIRGKVIPVVDLKKKLRIGSSNDDSNVRIIITNLKNKRVGFLVDAVEEVIRIDHSIIEQAPALSVSVDSDYISGVAKTEKGMTILLDINKIFSPQEQAGFGGF